jgi:hypothetical protein
MSHPAAVLAIFFCSGLAGGFALAYLVQAGKRQAPVWSRWAVWALTLCGGYVFAGYMGSVANTSELSSNTRGVSFGLLALAFLLSFLIGKHLWSTPKVPLQGPAVRNEH